MPPRRPWTIINWLFWASLLLYPFFQFVVNLVSSGSSLTLASLVLFFFVGRWAQGAWETTLSLGRGVGSRPRERPTLAAGAFLTAPAGVGRRHGLWHSPSAPPQPVARGVS